jgi:hypothetical protein
LSLPFVVSEGKGRKKSKEKSVCKTSQWIAVKDLETTTGVPKDVAREGDPH